MRRLALTAALTLATALPAAANEAVNRYEAASERLGEIQNTLLLEAFPTAAGKLPETDWDDAHRQAGACVLAQVAGIGGVPAMTALITNLEAAARRSYSDLGRFATQVSDAQSSIPGVSGTQVQAITEQCGLRALSEERMAASGIMAVIAGGN